MAVEMCSSASSFALSVDPTFNFGAYEVAPFTYQSILVESKSKNVTEVWVPAALIGPIVIWYENSTETYETAMRGIAKKCKLEESEELFVVTDGEAALINACEAVFNQCAVLRCTRHLEVNCREFLRKLGILSSFKDVSMK